MKQDNEEFEKRKAIKLEIVRVILVQAEAETRGGTTELDQGPSEVQR